MRNIIGKRVQEARRKFNPPLSQEELAARLEVNGWKDMSRVMVAKIESGIREVADFEMLALTKVLKVSADWLLERQGSEKGKRS